jgi:hypothetical protein
MESSFESLCCKLSFPFNRLEATGLPLASLLIPPGMSVCPYPLNADMQIINRRQQEWKNMFEWNFKWNPKVYLARKTGLNFFAHGFKRMIKICPATFR